MNFLCDEAGDCGKGANTVISQLHYFFQHHGLGEREVFLHADNCTGQNKNNCMLQYLAWRVMTGKHTQITLSFLVVGHTKFAPDWCFGLFKRLYRRTRVGCLQDIAQVVNESAHCNSAQLNVTEDGIVVVPTHDWTSFFAPQMRKFNGIKQYHHFRFPASKPGVMYVRLHCDTEEEEFILLKKDDWRPESSLLPDQITPKGLSIERQWYLYEKIREFSPEVARDLTCPEPDVPKPTSRAGTPVANIYPVNSNSGPTPTSSSRAGTAADASLPPIRRRSGYVKTAGKRATTAEHAQIKLPNHPLICFYNTLGLSGKFFLVSTSMLVLITYSGKSKDTCLTPIYPCFLTPLSLSPSPLTIAPLLLF